jgi:hypothetical protein
MAAKKAKTADPALNALAKMLDELYLALGLSVIALKQTKSALKKDSLTLRINALQFRDTIRNVQKMQRSLFAELKNARVIAKAD